MLLIHILVPVPIGMAAIVSEATVVSPMITTAGFETIMEGSTVMKPSMILAAHCEFVIMPMMAGGYYPTDCE